MAAGKINRVVDNKWLQDPLSIKSVQNNPPSGGQKSLIVGPRLLPIPTGNGTWTTNVTAATALPYMGALLAIYNNSGTAEAVTIGQSSAVTAQTIGGVDTNGNVGVACPPNSYSYVSMGYNQWIIANSANLIVYIIEDPTTMAQVTGPYAQQNAAV